MKEDDIEKRLQKLEKEIKNLPNTLLNPNGELWEILNQIGNKVFAIHSDLSQFMFLYLKKEKEEKPL